MSASTPTAASGETRVAPRLLLIGDSITQYGEDAEGDDAPGWVARLRGRVGVRMHVLNYGRSGYNSELGKRLLLRALMVEPNPTAVVLFFGANDAAVPPSVQSVSLEQYKQNLRTMVRLVQSHSDATPILVTPPPIDDNTRGPDRRYSRTKSYAMACVEVGTAMGVVCVDLHSRMEEFGLEQCLNDGLHLNSVGNRVCEETVVEVLEKQVGSCAPSTLQFSFMAWDEVDVEDVDSGIGPGLA